MIMKKNVLKKNDEYEKKIIKNKKNLLFYKIKENVFYLTKKGTT